MKQKEVLLEVKDLSVSFFNKTGEVQAVRGINYTLHKGEVLGIVGESGSGKSVSSHAILRLTPDSGKVKSGEILFEGKDILKMSKKEIRELRGNRIAMIFQDPMTSLDPLFTVEYQMNESLKKHTNLDAAARKKRIIELLDVHGLTDDIRYRLSGIQRRIGILKYDLHMISIGLHVLSYNGFSIIPDISRSRFFQPQDGSSQRGFSASALAHDSQRFTLSDEKTDVIDGFQIGLLHKSGTDREILFQILYFQQNILLITVCIGFHKNPLRLMILNFLNLRILFQMPLLIHFVF